MLSKIRGLIATLSIAIYLPIIILQIYFTRTKQNGRKARLQCRFFFKVNGFHIERIGEFDTSAQLIVLNHQSVSDIMFLEGFHPSNICWVAKKQLGEIPLYGYALTLPEMILINREDKSGIVFLLKAAKEKLAQGRPIVIFPEGTRGKGKEKLLPFKPGAKVLAEKLKLKIQPILLINTRKMYDTAPISSKTNKARLVALESFVPNFENPQWYEELETLMQETYAKHYAECNA